MKKFLTILILIFALQVPSLASDYGKGELKLSPQVVGWFIKYVKLGTGKKPSVFLVTTDGATSMYWQCPYSQCAPGNYKIEIEHCENRHGKECAVFARRRTVKWKNGINKGNKESKFNSKWSETQIEAKLTELGFLGNTVQKIEKKQTSQTNDASDITKQLKDLIKMYESGTITKEEFEKAKKKLLK
jgi:hypothetical protein